MTTRIIRLPLVGLALCLLLVPAPSAAAQAPEFDPFQENWARTDKAVADGIVNRTWMWVRKGWPTRRASGTPNRQDANARLFTSISPAWK